ncbi:MAG: hypothetical protein MGU50_01840 [Trichodesmium sp. MAG_R02]|nr:hypothetical protein [Trichodesmium sp. MAG_R02]
MELGEAWVSPISISLEQQFFQVLHLGFPLVTDLMLYRCKIESCCCGWGSDQKVFVCSWATALSILLLKPYYEI